MNAGARRPGRLGRGILGAMVGGSLGAGLSWFGGLAVLRSGVDPHSHGGAEVILFFVLRLVTVVGSLLGIVLGVIVGVASNSRRGRKEGGSGTASEE